MSKEQLNAVLMNIRYARTVKGYSQSYLGKKIGLSQKAYNKIEVGTTALTVERLLEISFILGTGLEELLSLNGFR